MPRKKNPDKIQRVAATFTPKQIELIDQMIGGEFGGTRAEIVKQIVLFHIRDKEKEKKSPLF